MPLTWVNIFFLKGMNLATKEMLHSVKILKKQIMLLTSF